MKTSADTQITNSETIENNKLIAEFMGLPKYKINFKGVRLNFENSKYNTYHKDWNQLMEVVEKIENIRMEQHENSMEYSVIIEQQRCIITSETQGQICYFAGNTGGKIAVVYDAVISFIKWYNSNK